MIYAFLTPVWSYILPDHLKERLLVAVKTGPIEDLKHAISLAKEGSNGLPIDFHFRIEPHWYLLCEVETPEKLGLLLDAGANPNCGETNTNPLYYAVVRRRKQNDKAFVTLLLERGAIATEDIMLELCSLFINDKDGIVADHMDTILTKFKSPCVSTDTLLARLLENFMFSTFSTCEHRLRVLLEHGANLLMNTEPAVDYLLTALAELVEREEAVKYLDILFTFVNAHDEGQLIKEKIQRFVLDKWIKTLCIDALDVATKRVELKNIGAKKLWLLNEHASGKEIKDPTYVVASYFVQLMLVDLENLSILKLAA